MAAATTGHFGQAAARLNLTQPGLTLRIQALEKELGAQLLDRNSREVHLTPAGQLLLPYAASLIEIEDRALSAMRQPVAAKAGRLRLSYLTLWDGLPARIVSAFRVRYPGVTVEGTSGYSERNLELVMKREVDVAFLTMALGDREGVCMRPIERHEMVLIMASTNPLAEIDSIPIKQLRGTPMIGVASGVNSAFADKVVSWLAHQLGEDPNVVAFEPPDQIAGAVANSRGAVALLTEARASAASPMGVVYRRLAPRPVLEYGAAYLGDNQSPVLADLLDEIVDELSVPMSEPSAGYETMSAFLA